MIFQHMANSGWETFIFFIVEKRENLDTNLYKGIRRLFPVQLMMGLLNTTVRGSSKQHGIQLLDWWQLNLRILWWVPMKICWRSIFFICKKTRSSSSKLANNSAHIYRCTIAAASTLLSLSIHHYRRWDGIIRILI